MVVPELEILQRLSTEWENSFFQCVPVGVCMYVHVSATLFVYTCVCVCVCECAYVCVYMCICVYVCVFFMGVQCRSMQMFVLMLCLPR